MVFWLLGAAPQTAPLANAGGVGVEIFVAAVVIFGSVVGWLIWRQEKLRERVDQHEQAAMLCRLCLKSMWDIHCHPEAEIHAALDEVIECLATGDQRNRKLTKAKAHALKLKLVESRSLKAGIISGNAQIFAQLVSSRAEVGHDDH